MQNLLIGRRASGIHPSLLDISFVLVFMFLLLSTLAVTTHHEAREQTLPPLNLAKMNADENSGTTSEKTLVISIQPGPAYLIGETPVTLADLASNLVAQRPPSVEIRGDVSIPYGAVTGILRVCQENGISRVALTYQAGN